MKTNSFLLPARSQSWVLALFLAALGSASVHAQLIAPTITDVRVESTNVVVTAQVPAGLRRVTLECRERFGRGAWEPRAVSRLDGSGGQVTFRLPRSRHVELMRVRADAAEPLPASFYTGASSFAEQPSSGFGPRGMEDFLGMTPGTVGGDNNTREVVESDIWRIRGQTLYFFNQYRGLQVIDLRNPDGATVRGTIELPAAGEDLYLLGESHVVLLAQNGCRYNESQVLVVADTGGSPSVVARLPVAGWISESRLVGTALYVAAQSYRPVAGTTNATWEWGTQVFAFDLANAAAPVARNTLWFAGYGNVVTATDRLLFVVTQDPANWWQSIIRAIDITNPDGTMRAHESIRVAGRLADKFKLHWNGSVLTSISEDWGGRTGRRLVTRLETFRLPDPRSLGPVGVVKLGELELGHGEQLHATRFDGDRAYIVTFFRIDPLWVVDVSDPARPRIAGFVDVPGWSTYIQPLGGRLVSIGVETNRVAVSLFDVSQPAAPALLSRVRLGQNYSYSEANWDEKAFSVLPEAGLILVPFSGDTGSNGWASSVQLVDLSENAVTARGIIEHRFQPRRATIYRDRILSLSGWELLSVDAADRDQPVVRGVTPLAWPVDRVFLAGDFLLTLGGRGGWGYGSDAPVLRVVPANAPDQILGQLALTNLPVLGAAKRGSHLYIAQGQGWYYPYYDVLAPAGGADATNDSPRSRLWLTVVELSALPAASIVAQIETNVLGMAVGGELQAVWPREGVLVWAGGSFNYWWRCLWCPVPLAADVAGAARFWPPYWDGGGGQLIAFDVARAEAPRLASTILLGGDHNFGSFSKAFTADGKVFVSHQASIQLLPEHGAVGDPVVYPPGGWWIARSFLNVVDYADADEPLVRKPVNIPGTLTGLSHDGAVLYTTGTHWKTNSTSDWTEYLDASAYDGVSAHLIDSLVLPDTWPRPVLVSGTNVFLGRSGQSPTVWWGYGPIQAGAGITNEASALETWFLSNAGRFTPSGRVAVTQPVSALAAFGPLLAAQQTDNAVVLFDATDGAALRQTGRSQPTGCLWFDLNHADGALGRGLWLPLGVFGVGRVAAAP